MTNQTEDKPNPLNKTDLTLKGNKNFDLFIAALSLIILLIILFDKTPSLFAPDLSVEFIAKWFLLIFFLLGSISSWIQFLDKTPQFVINVKGVYYKGQFLKRKKWKFFNWNDIETAYLEDKSEKGVTDHRLIFTTKSDQTLKIEISHFEVNEDDILNTIEKYSIMYSFGFLRDL